MIFRISRGEFLGSMLNFRGICHIRFCQIGPMCHNAMIPSGKTWNLKKGFESLQAISRGHNFTYFGVK